MAKSDSQNEKFILYLKNFGPWQGSSNQQAENNALIAELTIILSLLILSLRLKMLTSRT